MAIILGLDIGSNSVGSVWLDDSTGTIDIGLSIFPAGVEESDEKRGDPKNAKRRMTRRTRITLARRAERKRALRLRLIAVGLLPASEEEFKTLLDTTDPWESRRKGQDKRLTPHEFGRVLLHLAQRRGALGLKIADPEDEADPNDDGEDGKVKAAIGEVRAKMLQRKARTFGEFIAMVRTERVTAITTEDRRPENVRKGPREYRDSVRNKAGNYEHCADREMIHDEFIKLWEAQKKLGGETADLLNDGLRQALDDESRDSIWRHKGLLFGQRRATWDLGTLGRCALEPTERCAPHADMYALRYLVVETVNNLKIIERGKEPRPLNAEERAKIKKYLSGPLGEVKTGKHKGKPKKSVSVTDLRELMKWGRASKTTPFRFNIESDEDRQINTDWFSREIIHGAVTAEKWGAMPERVREGLNRAILKYDPDEPKDAVELRAGVMKWAQVAEAQADALLTAWKGRPKLDAKRLNMSRRAVRNLLVVMDQEEPWPDPHRSGQTRWVTQIEARKLIAENGDFKDVTTGDPMNDQTRRRYATGAKGATSRDRYYMRKHVLLRNGKPIIGPDGKPLAEPAPAPLISNPVVRKAIHEVRRHVVEFMTAFGRKPDEIYIELAREAKMGKMDSDRLLFRNRLRNRIKNEIIETFYLGAASSTQQRAAVDRVVLAVQQGGVCPLCGNQKVTTVITPKNAAEAKDCEVAHIIPKAGGGHNGHGNIVLAHDKCNRDMGRRTPRQFWEATLKGGFEEGMRYVEGIYQDIARPKPSEVKNATGDSLWSCYFVGKPGKRGPTFDEMNIEQFKKDIKDIQQMTPRQGAATQYATRQVMAYLADAVFDGKGLPERGGERLIYATDGMWTGRFRREWGLFFDRHGFKAKGISHELEHERKEKNRGDHRHHAIDAVVTAFCSRRVQIAWEEREKQADRDGINTASEEAMENYRRRNPLPPPKPFKTREEFREAVRKAVFGDGEVERPVSHRPVKRKLIGAFHKATQYGPVVDTWTRDGIVHRDPVEGRVTVRQPILGEAPTDFLKPAHLRMPRLETDGEAVKRLARRMRVGKSALSEDEAIKCARRLVKSKAYTRRMVDPKPEKGGIVRDLGLRRVLRKRLEERRLNLDSYSKSDLKRSIDKDGPLRHDSGVPIYGVVLLWSNTDPITIKRDHFDYATGEHRKLNDPRTPRLYDGQNNHHIEIRVNQKGKWSGEVVPTFEVAQRKLAKLRAFSEAGIPKPVALRKLSKAERAKLTPVLRAIEKAHPLVDRSDNPDKGGRFVMSLCEGEMLLMKHKHTDEVGYFVVAKLDKPQGIVLVPHWDARSATARKDAEGKKVPDSIRDQFSATPSDLVALAPPGSPHAVKVRVSPIGKIQRLDHD